MAKRKVHKTPATSEGARYERAATRARLRRQINNVPDGPVKIALTEELNWVLNRQKRYRDDKGGL